MIDSSRCLDTAKATERCLHSNSTNNGVNGRGMALTVASRETWIIVVKLSGRASESDH